MNLGVFASSGMKPLGLSHVLDSACLNSASMWLSSMVLFRYGVIVPRNASVNVVCERIAKFNEVYPVREGAKHLACVVHESQTSMRGYHLIGDADDIAKLWFDLYSGVCGLRIFDTFRRGFYWTGMVSTNVYVPYIDLDEKGLDEQCETRVIENRLLPTIAVIEKAFAKCGISSPAVQIFANIRKLEDTGLFKFSFHIHWYELGVENIGSWKGFLARLEDLPRKQIWKKQDTKESPQWAVGEDTERALWDPAVYSGSKQLFRGPCCGKEGRADAEMHPVRVIHTANGFVLEREANSIEKILRARISRPPQGLRMVKFDINPDRARSFVEEVPASQQEEGDTTGDMMPFFEPLLLHSIIPAWQMYRRQQVMKIAHVSGAVVPVDKLVIIKNEVGTRKGTRFLAIEGDTFCMMDPAHFHKTAGSRVIECIVDLVDCTVQQSCFACARASEPFCFLHLENSIRIVPMKEARFSSLDHFTCVKNIHQFLLDYYSERFRYHKKTELMWVYDEDTRCWKWGTAGNKIVGMLVDILNKKYLAYMTARRQILVNKQLGRINRNRGIGEEEKKKAVAVVYKEARKFLEKNSILIKATPDVRKRLIDDMRFFSAHREVKDFNCFPHLVPMKNSQCLNVFTMETEEMQWWHFFTSVLDAELLPTTHPDCVVINEWFKEISSGCKDKAQYLKRIAGYMFTMLIHDRKLYVLKGTGKNGKGLYKAFICNILNGPEGSEPRWKPFKQSFWEKRPGGAENAEAPSPEAYQMRDKSVFYTDDMDRVLIDACKVKRIVAGEPQSGRTLWGTSIQIKPTGKILWTSNFIPDGPGNDNAYWERFSLILFLTKYVEDTRKVNPDRFVFAMNDVVYQDLLTKLDAFFTVSVTELFEYYRTLPYNHEKKEPASLAAFPIPRSVEEASIEARETQFPLASFMREYTAETIHPLDYTLIDTLFQNYIVYLENSNERRLKQETTITSFARLLSSALDITCTKTTVVGIKLTKSVVATRDKQEKEKHGAFYVTADADLSALQ